MIQLHGPKSEEATFHENNGVETDPALDVIAKSRGIDMTRLLKTLKRRPNELTEAEQVAIIEYSSAILPKSLERKMIEMHRNNRDHLNLLLFNHNARAATKLATVYNSRYARTVINRHYYREDFLSAARYGLWMGATRFDIDRTYKGEPIKFITFATPWMFRYISEMMYEKRNMIPHQSLDAKAFQDSDTTLGDLLSEDDLEEIGYEDVDDEEREDDEPDMTIFDDDEENIEIEASDGSLLHSLEEDLSTIVGPGPGIEDFDVSADAAVNTLKEVPKAESISDTALAAITELCKKILTIEDDLERTVTIFIGRKYIRSVIKKCADDEIPEEIKTVHSMLKGVPASKKRLLEQLHMTADEFGKLCRHYTMQYINREVPDPPKAKRAPNMPTTELTDDDIWQLAEDLSDGKLILQCPDGDGVMKVRYATAGAYLGCEHYIPETRGGGSCKCCCEIGGTKFGRIDPKYAPIRRAILTHLNKELDC